MTLEPSDSLQTSLPSADDKAWALLAHLGCLPPP